MKILNVEITTLSKPQILEKINERILSKTKTVIFTPNPEMIEFVSKNILNIADFNLPDGTGLKIACGLKSVFSLFSNNHLRTMYYELRTVIHGIDFMLDLCLEAEKNNWSIGLLGGMNGIADKTRETLLQRFPKLKIDYVCGDFEYSVGVDPCVDPQIVETRHGASQSKNTPKPSDSNSTHTTPQGETQYIASLQQNNNTPPRLDILFVGLGTPKEQLWITENKEKFGATVFMEVGGAFDILSGRLKRAPKLVQAFGLEWLFRLIQEPKRFTRQLSLINFLWHVLTTKNSITN